MNINKLFGSTLLAMLLAFTSVAFAADKPVNERIADLNTSVIDAFGDSQITKVERDSLLIEWKKLSKLYTKYFKDKKLSKAEEKTLDSKMKKFDLNLFRKKYD